MPNYVIFSINTIYRYIGLPSHFSLPSFESSKVNVKNVPAMWAEKYSHAEYSYQYVNLPESKQPLLSASYGHGVTGNSSFAVFLEIFQFHPGLYQNQQYMQQIPMQNFMHQMPNIPGLTQQVRFLTDFVYTVQ